MTLLRNKIVLLFTLLFYTGSLTAALLYYRFPTESFKDYCESSLEGLLPDTSCSIKELSYSFPLGLTAKEIRFQSAGEEARELFFIDQAKIKSTPVALTTRFLVEIDSAEGQHSLTLLRDAKKTKFSLENIQIENFNLAKAPFLHQIMNRKISGYCQINGSYQGEWKDTQYQATGKGNITIEKGDFQLLEPILSLKKIDLQKMESDFVLQKNELKFTNGTFNGKELTGSFSGSVGMLPALPQSTFSFRGKMEPLAPLLKKSKYAQNMIIQLKKQGKRSSLPFLLEGTVQKPKFHFDS